VPRAAGAAMDQKDSLTIINAQFVGAWTIYNTFYMAFLTVNFLALALVVEKVKDPFAYRLICFAFVFQNGVSLITAIMIICYSRRVGAAFDQGGLIGVLAYSKKLAIWGGTANASSHILFIFLWSWLFVTK
jgi:hypothetical protein